ncbi:MAG: 2-isopropylmalate synthase, partial [Zoogloeaceae bacterium]|nr:2-isopropylmalate synthase [Zoogloeaceae bacterium]
ERAIGGGSDARAVAFIELGVPGQGGSTFGAGVSANIVTASIRAIVSAVNRVMARWPEVEARSA